MKNLRFVILVLLALLLPIRGAMAAAMLCPGEGFGAGAVVAIEKGDVAMPAEHGLHNEQATAHHHSADADAFDQDTSVPDGHPTACQVCASGCCFTPLAFAPPSVQARVLTTSVVFPALSLAIPAFEPGRQDRPPRTF